MERLAITFRYARGTVVRWAGDHHRYTVAQQRWTRRDVLGPVVEYLLVQPGHAAVWAYEADVWTEEEG
jgi:hypothetical protein